jgi:hypothetical protein
MKDSQSKVRTVRGMRRRLPAQRVLHIAVHTEMCSVVDQANIPPEMRASFS